MTAVCGGGPSAAKQGFATTVVVGAAAAGEYLSGKIGRPVGPMLAALIAGSSYNLINFCATDPPADPNLTANDVLNALGGGSTAQQIAALARVEQWFGHQYWYELCECTGTTTPAPPAPSNPGATDSNPQLPTGGTTIPCWNVERARSIAGPLSGGIDRTLTDLPATTRVTVTSPPFSGANTASRIPPGTTSLTFSGTSPAFPASGNSFAIQLRFFDSTGAEVSQISLLSNNSTGVTVPPFTAAIPGSAASWLLFDESTGATQISYHFQLTFFCSAAGPDQVQTPCCPPDPLLDIRLKTIIDLLISISSSGPGPSPPTGYVKGTVHSGLTGSQSLLVSSIIGVLVDVTQGIPARIVIGGNPPYQWDLGFLSILTGDGMIEQRRLTRQHQLWFPAQGEMATQVGIFLNPGVTINLTELKPA